MMTARTLLTTLALAMAAAVAGADPAGAQAPPPVAPTAQANAATSAGASGEALSLHAVRPGETLWLIAARYGMRAADLAALNGMRTTALLLPGRTLRVPLARAANARADVPALAAPDGSARQTLPADVGAASDETGGTPYEIAAGDTLYAIAAKFGVDIEAIKRRNGLAADGSIWAGRTLFIPARSTGATAPTPSAGGDDAPPSADAPATGASTTETVTVAEGETLGGIADRLGTTAAALMRLNGLSDDAIYAGQTLKVPHAGSGVLGSGGAKRIEVDISDQRMYVWEGANMAFNWTASTGLATHPTRTGSFAVQSKEPNAWSSAWQLWMPHWLGIYWAGGSENGIHALPIINGTTLWGGMLGSPVSYGCVVLDSGDAETLYNWADIGTPVEIHD